MDSSTISSIIIAVIAALVSVLSLFFTYFVSRAAESRNAAAKLDRQLKKFSQPLLIAAFDLQARLYELLQYPITDKALNTDEGIEDLWKFTCYRLARYLAAAWVLRETTYFLSMQPPTEASWWDSLFATILNKNQGTRRVYRVKSTSWVRQSTETDRDQVEAQRDAEINVAPVTVEIDTSASKIRDLLYKIDDELDRRRDSEGQNYGVFPGARLLISERMIETPSPTAGEVSIKREEDEGEEMKVKNWDTFRREWDSHFKEPCGWFLEWLTVFVEQRRAGILDPENNVGFHGRKDDHFRNLQHLLVDVVRYCDLRGLYNSAGAGEYRWCEPRAIACDCTRCRPNTYVGARHDSRKFDAEMERVPKSEI